MYLIKYKEQIQIDKFRRLEKVKTLKAFKIQKNNGLLYAWVNQFNIITLDIDYISNIRLLNA